MFRFYFPNKAVIFLLFGRVFLLTGICLEQSGLFRVASEDELHHGVIYGGGEAVEVLRGCHGGRGEQCAVLCVCYECGVVLHGGGDGQPQFGFEG